MDDTELQELQKDTFVVVVFLIAILDAVFFYIVLITFLYDPKHAEPFWWLPATLTFLTCLFSYKLYKNNRFRLGTHLFVGGLMLAVISFATWSLAQFGSVQAYLLLLVVAMAGLLINPSAAVRAAGVAIIASLGVCVSLYGFSWAIFQVLLAPLTMTGAMAIISWVSSDNLTTAISWAMGSEERARQRTEELFESQQELQKAYRLLETTNVRLQKAEAAAVKANELKTRFITNLSHELRTPLSAIINFSYILSKNHYGQVTSEQRDYLMRIHGAGELLIEIVNDLLDLAKIEAGQMELFREPVDLAAVSAEVMSTVSGLLTDKSVELRQEIPPDLPRVIGDETRIRQVLLNLLGNAAKYTSEGTITLRIIAKEKKLVQVSVIDTGIGIRPEDFEKIFEEFQQTEEAFALRKVGTGLGLPISRKFVELHGGQLWVESERGRGSAFHFTLPVAPNGALLTLKGAKSPVNGTSAPIINRVANYEPQS
jgi:signal transduction histidine kinase